MVEFTSETETETNKTVRTNRRRRGAGRPRRFTREEARAIRRRKAQEKLTLAQLKDEMGVSIATIQKIVKGEGAYANTL